MKCKKCSYENPPGSAFCSKCGTQVDSGTSDANVTQAYSRPNSPFAVGGILDERYQMIEELGRGGMGRVYKALDLEIDEKVALKVLNPEISSDQKTIERFRNELKLARKIRHKNVCQMFDLDTAENTYFITMEYVSGEDLKSTVNRLGRLSEGKILLIAKQICKGLAEAHRVEVIHRDLKPQNIMIDRAGDVRIMDFGIARTLQPTGLTETGMMIGTPDYMAPEQAVGEPIDNRTDIYSLGVILFELATGRVPFKGDTAVSVALKHKTEAPPRPKNINPNISERFNDLILKCLEKEKKDRYQSVDEILADIVAAEKGHPVADKVIPDRPASVQIPRKRLPLAAVLGPLALIILAIVGYLLIKPKAGGAADVFSLSLDSNPEAVLVFLDNRELGTTPIKKDIAPGKYTLKLEKEGFVTRTERITIDADFKQTFALQALAVAPSGAATLEITTLPEGAEVFIGEESLGFTPFIKEMEAGAYTLVLKHPGYLDKTEEITLLAGETYPKEFILEAEAEAQPDPDPPAKKPRNDPVSAQYRLNITSAPSNAKIYIDGQFQGRTPLNGLKLSKKDGFLRMNLEGYVLKDFQLNLDQNNVNKIHGDLQKAEFQVKLGSIPPGAAVFEGSEKLGETPFAQALAIGTHNLVLKKTGFRDKPVTMDLQAEYQESVTLVPLEKINVKIQVRPTANIAIDNVSSGPATTIVTTDILEGRHTITFTAPDNSQKYSLPLELKPGEKWEVRMFMSTGKCLLINLVSGAQQEKQLKSSK